MGNTFSSFYVVFWEVLGCWVESSCRSNCERVDMLFGFIACYQRTVACHDDFGMAPRRAVLYALSKDQY